MLPEEIGPPAVLQEKNFRDTHIGEVWSVVAIFIKMRSNSRPSERQRASRLVDNSWCPEVFVKLLYIFLALGKSRLSFNYPGSFLAFPGVAFVLSPYPIAFSRFPRQVSTPSDVGHYGSYSSWLIVLLPPLASTAHTLSKRNSLAVFSFVLPTSYLHLPSPHH